MLIFMEFCAEGTLESLVVATENGLPEALIRRYTLQMLLGVSELHNHGIVHRDIKSANIFLTDEGNSLKLGDFGSAAKIKAHTTVVGELQGYVGTQGTIANLHSAEALYHKDCYKTFTQARNISTAQLKGVSLGEIIDLALMEMVVLMLIAAICDRVVANINSEIFPPNGNRETHSMARPTPNREIQDDDPIGIIPRPGAMSFIGCISTAMQCSGLEELFKGNSSAVVQLISTLSALPEMFGTGEPIKSQNQPSRISAHVYMTTLVLYSPKLADSFVGRGEEIRNNS
uniref:Protein kinase domain-containing protein n=1 Tax=Timema douglasi TaxID=61478 RepID=A0A7R8VWJ8_TIMDO|nr:unnamed protein product [Timema douglasi]